MTEYLWQRAFILALAMLIGWIAGSFFWGVVVALAVFFMLTIGWSLVAPWIDRRNPRDGERPRRF